MAVKLNKIKAQVTPVGALEVKKSLDINASVYTAECAALDEAMNIALANKNSNFIIFSDSRSSLQSLNSLNLNVKTNEHTLNVKKNTKNSAKTM